MIWQVGNVYVQFREEEHAANALRNLTGRFYAGSFFFFHLFQIEFGIFYLSNICSLNSVYASSQYALAQNQMVLFFSLIKGQIVKSRVQDPQGSCVTSSCCDWIGYNMQDTCRIEKVL